MSYDYKDEIKMNIKDYNAGRRVITGGTNAFESKLSELDRVYAQAAKADEYEAKAKAFDRIVEEVKLTEFEIREKELDSSDVGYRTLGIEITRFVLKEEGENAD